MGNKNASQEPREMEHPKLGLVILSGGSPPTQIQHNFTIKEAKEGEAFEAEVDKLSKMDKENLFLPSKIELKGKGLCGSSGLAKTTYPLYPYTLDGEITQRKTNQVDFKEREILYLLYIISRVGSQFEKTSSRIGDMRPQNILMNSDGNIKIYCLASAPNESSSYLKAYQGAEKAYLGTTRYNSAPQELEELSKNNAYPTTINDSKAEVFGLGLVALQLGTKQNITDIYNYTIFKIDNNKLDDLKFAFQKNYSDVLSFIVREMVEVQPEKRPSFSEIATLLQPYREDIEQHRDVKMQAATCLNALRKKQETGVQTTDFSEKFAAAFNLPSKWSLDGTSKDMHFYPSIMPHRTNSPLRPSSQIRQSSPLRPIPRPQPIGFVSQFQDVIPSTNFTQSIYQPAPPTMQTNSVVIKDSKIPTIRWTYNPPNSN